MISYHKSKSKHWEIFYIEKFSNFRQEVCTREYTY